MLAVSLCLVYWIRNTSWSNLHVSDKIILTTPFKCLWNLVADLYKISSRQLTCFNVFCHSETRTLILYSDRSLRVILYAKEGL